MTIHTNHVAEMREQLPVPYRRRIASPWKNFSGARPAPAALEIEAGRAQAAEN